MGYKVEIHKGYEHIDFDFKTFERASGFAQTALTTPGIKVVITADEGKAKEVNANE